MNIPPKVLIVVFSSLKLNDLTEMSCVCKIISQERINCLFKNFVILGDCLVTVDFCLIITMILVFAFSMICLSV